MRKLTLVVVVTALVSLGCAQDDPTLPEPPEETAASTPSPDGTAEIEYNDEGTETLTSQTGDLDVVLDDFFFKPTFIKLPGDATVNLTLTNEGEVAHTFTSDTLDFDVELEPGSSEELEVEVGTETRYEFWCTFHAGQGMRGAFQPH